VQVYCVGGAVRDQLLGLPVQDHDYVVVGATPQQMEALGYRPVGKDFPVFLHPKTNEEYALARTERKTAKGYKGFQVYSTPEINLEQDLARRDLTINAIARDEQGRLIDPYGGVDDLRAGILRHVSPAFIEDPVRILRLARFAARYPEFTVANETQALLQQMVVNGEVDALVPERVWQELAKGLMEVRPSRMFEVLRNCGALDKILPEVECLFGVPQPPQHHPEIDAGVHAMLVIDYAARQNYGLSVRFAALTHDLGKGATPKGILPRHIGHEQRSVELVRELCRRLRVPNDYRDLAVVVAGLHGKVYRALELRPETVLQLLHDADALRQPERFERFLQACECDLRGRTGLQDSAFPQADYLRVALRLARAVDAGAIASQQASVETIRSAVFAARVAAIAALNK
jgi:tRNA nucleotidyltransferase (CCA-adding enzyme)